MPGYGMSKAAKASILKKATMKKPKKKK